MTILNAKWKKHIDDSIEIVEVKIRQAILDSIERAKEDSLTQVRANEHRRWISFRLMIGIGFRRLIWI
jgi:hypothetical protein